MASVTQSEIRATLEVAVEMVNQLGEGDPDLRALLSQAGFSATLAEDGVHGLEVLEGMAPDAIITDINMPRLDGFGFVEAVRGQEAHKTMPIQALTTESAPESRS